jgi:peroxiredoxin
LAEALSDALWTSRAGAVRSWAALAPCVLAVACGGQLAGSGSSAPGAVAPADGAAEARAAGAAPPDFELATLDGGSVRLSDHLGKDVVLIDFWATYCEPCLRAMPHLDELYTKHRGRGFVVLGVCIDGPDSLPEVRAEVRKLGVTFPILLDRETRVVSLYNPKTSAPFSVLIDRAGRIRVKREGYTTGAGEALDHDVEAALGAR